MRQDVTPCPHDAGLGVAGGPLASSDYKVDTHWSFLSGMLRMYNSEQQSFDQSFD
jgi:hypothetical protein